MNRGSSGILAARELLNISCDHNEIVEVSEVILPSAGLCLLRLRSRMLFRSVPFAPLLVLEKLLGSHRVKEMLQIRVRRNRNLDAVPMRGDTVLAHTGGFEFA